ncbi:MAG: ABZJ_00895 family protein [Campylobacteraceae bacterium]|jgi:hypothetical protein|nr:ABZJ_00895 family protein [Campylobacteraceae bacterium]
MKKYILPFFLFLVLFFILSVILAFILGVSKLMDYHADLIIFAMSSIITGLIFVMRSGRAPTQKEIMTYTVSIITILIILSIAWTTYRLKSLADSDGPVLTASDINTSDIGYFVAFCIKYILVIHLPFYFTCKLLSRKYAQ